MPKLDPETAEALHEGTELRRMVESEGWRIARAYLMGKLAVLDSVSSLPADMSFEARGQEALLRQHTIAIVTEWLNELEGRLDQNQEQVETLIIEKEETIIRRH
jgi:hypothetical protein